MDLPHRAERLQLGHGREGRQTSRSIRKISRGRRLDPGAADGGFGDLELRDRLEKAIAQLPDQQRLLIAAHYLDGVQYEALAEAMDIPLGTVKTHLYRAKKRLRELLDS